MHSMTVSQLAISPASPRVVARPGQTRSRLASTAVRAHYEQQKSDRGLQRRLVQLASLVGAAGIALLPFDGSAYARPSDLIQSRGKNSQSGEATKFNEKASLTGQQARAPSTRKRTPATDPQKFSNRDQSGNISDKAIDISPRDLAPSPR